MHFVEQLCEFHETMRKTGTTPVELLADEGVLGPRTILAHAIYLAGHSARQLSVWRRYRAAGDRRRQVAHSPVAFSRRGVALESFERYRDAGIGVALGTDTYPLDMFSEMRTATHGLQDGRAQLRGRPAPATSSPRATSPAPTALGRHDLGRIAAGAKADIVIVDSDKLAIGPVPIRSARWCISRRRRMSTP